jgi:hypothetical protein
MFVRKSLSTLAAGALLCLTASTAAADSIILGGIEDHVGTSAVEGHGDYNDLMFTMTGNISVLAPQAGFNPLTQSLVDESGTIFWDQHSYDGVDYNFGYCATGWGNCVAQGPALGALNYVAGPGGAAPLTELFQASGAITMSLFFEKTSNANGNTVGWYDPTNPTVLHQILTGQQGTGASAVFTPSQIFALYSTDGLGQIYSSVAAANQEEAVNQQHFALLVSPIPEPGTGRLAGILLAAAFATRLQWKNSHKPVPVVVRAAKH